MTEKPETKPLLRRSFLGGAVIGRACLVERSGSHLDHLATRGVGVDPAHVPPGVYPPGVLEEHERVMRGAK